MSTPAPSVLGPHQSYEYYLWIKSKLLKIGIFLLVLPFFVTFLLPVFPSLTWFETYLIGRYVIGLGALCILITLVASRLLYKSTSFVVRDQILYISYGLVNQVTNTVPLRFIYDCDVYCGPVEQLLGVKTLQLRVMSGGGHSYIVLLCFLKDADLIRDYLLSYSAVRTSNIVTAM